MSASPPNDPFAPLVPEPLAAFYDAMRPPQQAAAALLALLNRAADPSFKSRYARRWWGMLEERAKLGAMISSDLTRWASTVTARLGGAAGRSAEDRRLVQAILVHWEGADAAVLDALQHDTPVVVAFVRALSDETRAQSEATHGHRARGPAPPATTAAYWAPDQDDPPEGGDAGADVGGQATLL